MEKKIECDISECLLNDHGVCKCKSNNSGRCDCNAVITDESEEVESNAGD